MTEQDLERQAEAIADEAVAGYERTLAPHVIAEIRRTLIADMLATDEGRAALRQSLEDPVVSSSQEVGEKPAEALAPTKIAGRRKN
ncbi:MAG: hypothetical protein U0414_32020 [Polyangiaceae bacterium]